MEKEIAVLSRYYMGKAIDAMGLLSGKRVVFSSLRAPQVGNLSFAYGQIQNNCTLFLKKIKIEF